MELCTELAAAFFSAICTQKPEISAIHITYFQVSFVGTSLYEPKSHQMLVAIQIKGNDSIFSFLKHF